MKDYEQKKPPAQIILQSISNVVFTESIIISQNTWNSTANSFAIIPEPGKTQLKQNQREEITALKQENGTLLFFFDSFHCFQNFLGFSLFFRRDFYDDYALVWLTINN